MKTVKPRIFRLEKELGDLEGDNTEWLDDNLPDPLLGPLHDVRNIIISLGLHCPHCSSLPVITGDASIRDTVIISQVSLQLRPLSEGLEAVSQVTSVTVIQLLVRCQICLLCELFTTMFTKELFLARVEMITVQVVLQMRHALKALRTVRDGAVELELTPVSG